ncbi:MAG TPA: peptide chain release factor N(5)-glutamine methyltransferase [Planctomycetota bacterium]|jgi:release factor glutamine methyltransferase|nr:peptide chain release factor N(5)-glutamine methyltransferase [Planctomycetota bacterium]
MSRSGGEGPRTLLEFVLRASAYLAARGIPSARLDAEVLLAHVLGVRRLDLYLEHGRSLAAGEVEAYRAVVRRRGDRVPVAYLTGEREFFSLRFRVSPDVLIPRPETEILVEEALAIARGRAAAGETTLAADVGTGSGCIAVALARGVPSARVVATDRSGPALALARENASAHGVLGRVAFARADLLEAFQGRSLDLVVSNPPYVDPAERGSLPPEVRDHEPAEAVFAPAGDPLALVRALAAGAARALRPGGVLLLEIAAGTRAAVEAELLRAGLGGISFRRDLAGIDRVARSDAV